MGNLLNELLYNFRILHIIKSDDKELMIWKDINIIFQWDKIIKL